MQLKGLSVVFYCVTKKTFMKTHLLIILAIMTGIASSCIMIGNCVDGNGNTITEERTVSTFTSVSNETSFEVIYRRSNVVSVTVEAESNIIPYIETDVHSGSLEVRTTRGTRCIDYTVKPVIVVTSPFVDELVNAGSGDIIAGPLEGEEVRIIVSGSGDIVTGSVSSTTSNLIISGSGELKTGAIETDDVKVTMSGSGNLETRGNTLTARYVLSGSGILFAENLVTDDANVTISGSGSVYTTVLQSLDAVLSGSGNIYLYGDPDVSVSRTGSGKVINL